MAGEIAIINPRRRRRRARRKSARSSHRRRRHVARVMNPRRRRRSVARRHVRRRRARRNPSMAGLRGGLMGGLKSGIGLGIGLGVAQLGTSAVIKYVPGIPDALKSGLGKSALKIAVGAFVAPMVLKMMGQRELAANAAKAAWAIVIYDLLNQYVTPALGLGDYSYGTLEDYSQGSLEGIWHDELSGIYGDQSSVPLSGSVYQGGVYS